METTTTETPTGRHAPESWEINQIWAEPLIHCEVRLPNLTVCSLQVGVWFRSYRTDDTPLEWGWQVCRQDALSRWRCPDFRGTDRFPTWQDALADAFRHLLGLGDEAAAARLAAFEAGKDETGPVAGGAPDAEWVEFDVVTCLYCKQVIDDRVSYAGVQDGDGETIGYAHHDCVTDDIDAEPTNGTHDPETGEGHAIDVQAIHDRTMTVMRNFPTERIVRDGTSIVVCKLCGLDIFDHDPESCQGGTPETRKRRSKNGTNGAHDPAITERAEVTV